jgi:hypothetical protein
VSEHQAIRGARDVSLRVIEQSGPALVSSNDLVEVGRSHTVLGS